ncbi:MAG: hypothetical protein JRJ08_02155, partial [Deltaproteobacteria bacterium]|nr:hypothetical protein [Deltaproteobacteria bacterium]
LKLNERYNNYYAGRGKYLWHSGIGKVDPSVLDPNRTFYIVLPLADKERQTGSLVLAKDLLVSSLTPNILRRIENLRRTVTETLLKLVKNGLVNASTTSENPNSLFTSPDPSDQDPIN